MIRNDDNNDNINANNNYFGYHNEYDVEYDSDGSDGVDDDDEFNFYGADEPSSTRFNIVFCEIYNRNIHGLPPRGSLVDTHYLVSNRFKNFDTDVLNDISYYMNAEYIQLTSYNDRKHPIIRNYHNIIANPYYIRPEIAQCVYLLDNECVAILKTFWIRIIQRVWKRVFKERKQIIKEKSTLKYITNREISCPKSVYWPGLKGMLHGL
jgi:hypothetical protein